MKSPFPAHVEPEDYLEGNLSWTPPAQQTSLEGYVVYLANSASGAARVWLPGEDLNRREVLQFCDGADQYWGAGDTW